MKATRAGIWDLGLSYVMGDEQVGADTEYDDVRCVDLITDLLVPLFAGLKLVIMPYFDDAFMFGSP